MTFHLAEAVDEVLTTALGPAAEESIDDTSRVA
jgi:hypothetical protein